VSLVGHKSSPTRRTSYRPSAGTPNSPRAVRSVSNANRTVISNTPTRSSDWIPECSPAAETSRENYSTPVFVSRSSLF
jgi:hypothetical protein